MKLLIDGHNLIGRMTDMALGEPHVERQLVGRLKRYAVRTGRKVTVIFDGGLPGGPAPDLSGGNVTVVFAPAGRPADDLLIGRIRRIRDRQGTLVVSSDREILDAAGRRNVRTQHAEEFVADLVGPASSAPVDPRQVPPSDAEVEAWLREFSE